MVGIQQILGRVIILLWRGFIELKNNSISTDCKQSLTSAKVSEQVNVLEGNKDHAIGKRV